MTQNKMNQPIKIRYNQRLEHLTELNYKRCYHIAANESIRDLMIWRSEVTHWTEWLRCLCHTALTATLNVFKMNSEETILLIDVTVYEDITIMKVLFKIADQFLNVWKDSDRFVNLFINNWIWISLKSDWNNKMLSKVRVYSLDL